MAENPLDLTGQVAFVTGGGSGIGKGAALAFAQKGAIVALAGRNEEDLSDVAKEIKKSGGKVETYKVDVSKSDDLKRAYEDLIAKYKRLDIVFANAGINGVWAPIEEITEEEYDLTMNGNLKGTFLTIQHAVPFLKRRGGSILVTASVNGNRIFSNTGATVYSTSKAGQVAMAKMLAVELAQWKVRVNAICPGAIETNIADNTEQRDLRKIKIPVDYPEGEIPLTGKEPGTIEEVGQLALFLVSNMAKHITGEVVYIDGGQSLLQG